MSGWPAQRVWSVLAEHFVQPVEHDAVLEAEVVELAVQECAVVACEDLMSAARIRCCLDGGRGLPVQLLIVAGIVEAEQRALDLLGLGHQPRVPRCPAPRRPGAPRSPAVSTTASTRSGPR